MCDDKPSGDRPAPKVLIETDKSTLAEALYSALKLANKRAFVQGEPDNVRSRTVVDGRFNLQYVSRLVLRELSASAAGPLNGGEG